MSDPEKKAKEIVGKYRQYALSQGVKKEELCEEDLKQCALICVNEMIEHGFSPRLPYDFWKKVKTEIKKM